MLTRDIDLLDAILDLVDNSIDGMFRKLNGTSSSDLTPYKIELILNDEMFSIKDNCGGIELNTAINYAFKLGRDKNDDRDLDVSTIGMYGIGMKRAIFKIGKKCSVKSYADKAFEVEIGHDWLESNDWSLPLKTEDVDILKDKTEIEVSDLSSGVKEKISSESFQDELYKSISRHYSRFIQKGLEITINGNDKIKPYPIKIFVDKDGSVKPYIYHEIKDGLEIKIVCGFNSPPKSNNDDSDSKEIVEKRGEDESGWTIFCNDRAVVFNDKTFLTGWGDGLPKYHPQFVVLSGVVEFNSTNASYLPVTTTKRGVDTSSDIYIRTKQLMKNGMKIFTSYTNKWKNFPRSDQKQFFDSVAKLEIPDIFETVIKNIPEDKWTTKKKDYEGGKEFIPNLPPAPRQKPDTKRISFTKKIRDIKDVAEYLFDDSNVDPNNVGEEAFNYVLSRAKEL
jgi:hypothetical protein